jgi:hypothetical protein
MTERVIHLGYELGTGEAVAIPLKHMAVTGQTQESGKTTTLEALVERGGLWAIAFVTKRAEGSFASGRRIQPYFRERADWQFVAAVLEATLRERLKFERSWIMRACRGAKTLADVHRKKLNKALKAAAADGFVEIKKRAGLHGGLRAKLAADLAAYDATEDDIEQTYAACMAALAGAAVVE